MDLANDKALHIKNVNTLANIKYIEINSPDLLLEQTHNTAADDLFSANNSSTTTSDSLAQARYERTALLREESAGCVSTTILDTIAEEVDENDSVESLDIHNCKSSELLARASPGFVKKATLIWEVILSGGMYDPTRGKIQSNL